MRLLLISFFLMLSYEYSKGQGCSTIGQTPSTAFPVCGTSIFHQATVPICSTHSLDVPGCSNDGANYADKNPFWYKFTCYQSGNLGFLIKPTDQGDDYDWMLYDITGHNPDDVFTNKSLIVAGNWAGTLGNTGARASGVNFIQCASDPAQFKNSYSTMPNLIKGHTYLLLVSHFTDSQSGYDLSFGGGKAVITDTTMPHLKSIETSCGGDTLRIKLNKKVKCSSLASDGSDFAVSPSVRLSAVSGVGCAAGFDTDSIELYTNTFLPSGNYKLQIMAGSDGNTLVDFCDNAIPTTDNLNFTIAQHVPTPMDSVGPLACAPAEIHLIFSKPINCGTVAADGSDFSISGSYPVTITGAHGNCGPSGGSRDIVVTLSAPLYVKGNFTIRLQAGTDGNTLIDNCGNITPAGSFVTFSVKDTVSAVFSFTKNYGCLADTVHFSHPGGNEINSWQWSLDDQMSSSQQNPVASYTVFSNKAVSLVVSNGFCTDSSSQTVVLDNYLKADFFVDPDICPNEAVSFTSSAQGRVVKNLWQFGDGDTSADVSPHHIYAAPTQTVNLMVSYTISDSMGCQNSVQKPVTVYNSCYLAVPTAFTPNGDGLNDYFHPLNAVKALRLTFKVFNRWGQLVFETNDWKKGWDGTFHGQPQPTGVYVWYLTFTDRDTKAPRNMKGTITLIR